MFSLGVTITETERTQAESKNDLERIREKRENRKTTHTRLIVPTFVGHFVLFFWFFVNSWGGIHLDTVPLLHLEAF